MTDTNKRSRGGCWTCKKRRRRCDEGKPTCRACETKGLICEGYEKRLRWGNGVASRGHLTGAQDPRLESVPARLPGRQRDSKKQNQVQIEPHQLLEGNNQEEPQFSDSNSQNSTPNHSTPSQFYSDHSDSSVQIPTRNDTSPIDSMTRQRLFDEFITSGHLYLYSTSTNDDSVGPMILELSQDSITLFSVCVAFQALISNIAHRDFLELYDTALSHFRSDLAQSIYQQGEAVLIAGLLMCTIGMFQGSTWTIHLAGLEQMLLLRGILTPDPTPELSPYADAAVQVMGIMDLPFFVLGRKHPSMNVWRRYRSGRMPCVNEEDSVETMSGLPVSLIDIFSCAEEPLTEKAFWLWPGFAGEIVQCQLWEAYRFAGILDLRRRRLDPREVDSISNDGSPSPSEIWPEGSLSSAYVPPSQEILIARLISSLDGLHNCTKYDGKKTFLVMNSAMYPIFIAAVEVNQLKGYDQWKRLVASWFEKFVGLEKYRGAKLTWDIFQEICRRSRDGTVIIPDMIANELGTEVSLL